MRHPFPERVAGRVAAHREDVRDAGRGVGPDHLPQLAHRVRHRGEVGHRDERGVGGDAGRGPDRPVPAGAPRAIGDGDECGVERLEPSDGAPQLGLTDLVLRREELHREDGTVAADPLGDLHRFSLRRAASSARRTVPTPLRSIRALPTSTSASPMPRRDRSGPLEVPQVTRTGALDTGHDPFGAEARSVDQLLDDTGLVVAVEAALAAFLRSRTTDATAIDPAFAEATDALLAFVLQGGKRIRPTFAWWGWRGAGGAVDSPEAVSVLRAVSALELIQACALIHDDLMDASATRRGRPTVHVEFARRHVTAGWTGQPARFGAAAAILLGDLALAWADDMLRAAGLPQAALLRAAPPWQAMRTEMLGGQYLDVLHQATGDTSTRAALQIDRYKTAAYTVERPLHLGAAIADARPELISAYRRFGADIGVAFQLRDDLLGRLRRSRRHGQARRRRSAGGQAHPAGGGRRGARREAGAAGRARRGDRGRRRPGPRCGRGRPDPRSAHRPRGRAVDRTPDRGPHRLRARCTLGRRDRRACGHRAGALAELATRRRS